MPNRALGCGSCAIGLSLIVWGNTDSAALAIATVLIAFPALLWITDSKVMEG